MSIVERCLEPLTRGSALVGAVASAIRHTQKRYLRVEAEVLPPLPPKEKRELTLSPSSLAWEPDCPRYHIFESQARDRKTPPRLITETRMIHGKAMHAVLQAILTDAKVIEKFDGELTVELQLGDGIKIKGKIDAVLTPGPNGRRRLAEIKSKEETSFLGLDVPDDSHARQAQLYLWLVKRGQAGDKSPRENQAEILRALGDIDEAVVLYWDKNDKPYDDLTGLPMREFAVLWDPASIRPVMETIEEVVAAWAAREHDVDLPGRVAGCETKGARKARRCDHADTCFACDKWAQVWEVPKSEFI